MVNGKKVSAVIAEYDPFHNGHRYHIEQTRQSGAGYIIAVMSGAIVQRGGAAIYDKHFRARQAVLGGVDLVIELPCPFSCSCAEIFADKAIEIITKLGAADELSFGCECGDTDILEKCADISASMAECPDIAKYMAEGMSYPAAFEKAVCDSFGEDISKIFSEPNNVLAIEYIKALKRRGSGIKPLAVTRFGAAHRGETVCSGIASASMIRGILRSGGDIRGLVPYLPPPSEDICDTERMSGAVFLRLLQIVNSGGYKNVPDFTDELASRFVKAAAACKNASLSELISAVKSKSFTYAKAARAFINAYLGVTKSDMELAPHARILAFNDKGRELLKEIRERAKDIEIVTSISELSDSRLAWLDDISCRFQGFCRSDSIVNEYTREFDGYVSERELST